MQMQQILRRPMLALADNRTVEGLMRRNGFSKGLVRRFVAGEDLETALEAVRGIAAQGMTATLDQLGENVATVEEARAAASSYVTILRRMAAADLEPNISVKLTMLGLDLGDNLARENMVPILEAAREVGGFVRIDMEGSAYTQRTLDLFYRLRGDYDPDTVGIVLQSYLYRTTGDVEQAIASGSRVRLVKGAYNEPPEVAFPDKAEVDRKFVEEMQALLEEGVYPAIATHDEAMIDATRRWTFERGISKDSFEFQMLYGVRRDLQRQLLARGYRLRVYVPYGTEWYPYFMRRLAERPANLAFFLRQLVSR